MRTLIEVQFLGQVVILLQGEALPGRVVLLDRVPALLLGPSPPPSAGWSLISAGKGQKEGEAGEAGRGNKGRKVGRITHEDEKAEGRRRC